MIKNLPAKAGDTRDVVPSLDWEDTLEYSGLKTYTDPKGKLSPPSFKKQQVWRP